MTIALDRVRNDGIVPTYLSPGVYFEEFSREWSPLSRTDERPAIGSPRGPLRAQRSRWSDARSLPAIIGFASMGPVCEPTFIRNPDEFSQWFGTAADSYLYSAVLGFFDNGGDACFVIRAGEEMPTVTSATASIMARDREDQVAFTVSARYGGAVTNEMVVEVGNATTSLDTDAFALGVHVSGQLVEHFDDLSMSGRRDAMKVVNDCSRHVTLDRGWPVHPELGQVHLGGWSVAAATNASAISAADVEAAIDRIADLPGIDAVCIPDLVGMHAAGVLSLADVQRCQQALINRCEWHSGAIAILDAPPGLTVEQVRHWRLETTGYDSAAAALYYPWIRVYDPASGTTRSVPPSGHIAGMWARVAVEAGLHRSPANESLVGALGTDVALSRGELDLINPVGVNTILAAAGAGMVVWGARTLSSDPARRLLRHVRVVRFVERNIVDGMRWVIHERSDPDLWDQIADELRGFFGLLFRAGVLGGPTPEQAFSVRCDHSTNDGLAGEGRVSAEFWINFDDGSQRAGRVSFVSG
jgi:hypothetical protein